jgi:hypothetical protein
MLYQLSYTPTQEHPSYQIPAYEKLAARKRESVVAAES